MKKYCVMENGLPAKYPGCNESMAWQNNEFDTIEEALRYFSYWLGKWRFALPLEIECNKDYDYTGYGDIIRINIEEK